RNRVVLWLVKDAVPEKYAENGTPAFPAPACATSASASTVAEIASRTIRRVVWALVIASSSCVATDAVVVIRGTHMTVGLPRRRHIGRAPYVGSRPLPILGDEPQLCGP